LSKVPILFLVFNRPNHTGKVFEAIKKYKPSRLYIAADGPRNAEEQIVCSDVKKVVQSIDWDCEVFHLYREKNLGCRDAVKTAIDWFFLKEEAGIILEDDCLPSDDFFEFCRIMLDRFKDDERIGIVGGNNFGLGDSSEYSIFFTNYCIIWGWATWRRAWEKYQSDASVLAKPGMEQILSRHFSGDELTIRTENFNSVYAGKVNTWDYQWHLTCLMQNMLTVVPKKNLISNIGFDSLATHTKSGTSLASESMDLSSLQLPGYIYFNEKFEKSFKLRLSYYQKVRRFASKVKWLVLK